VSVVSTLVDLFRQFVVIFLRLDQHLTEWAQSMGGGLYVLLFAVVFCETGLVVTPFLPGDSLLFATGALCALDGSPLNVVAISALLIVAAVLGDAVNYMIGYRLGPKVFSREKSFLLNVKHLQRTQAFYEKHGGKTIILARFIPILRTFAPFVAGRGKMQYRRFALFNVTGAVVWVVLFTALGYGFGNLPGIKRNFQYVILAIIVVSVLPMVVEIIRARRAGPEAAAAPAPK
jgi:membrane-associated protein